MKLTSMLIATFVLTTTIALAQGVDISGTWNAKTVSARGTSEQTISFSQSGDTFTGEMVNSAGAKEPIADGKISGNDIQFNVERKRPTGEVSKVAYEGTVKGDEITGTFTGASGATINWTAKRAAGGMDNTGGM